jgi:hypothetical protein
MASAPPVPPCAFYGNVTVGGKPAKDGLIITAQVVGCALNWTTQTVNGAYGWETRGSSTFLIPSDDQNTSGKDGGVTGDPVVFYVGGTVVGQTATFVSGGAKEFDLSISGTSDNQTSNNQNGQGGSNTQYPLYAAVFVTAAAIGSVGVFWKRKNGHRAHHTKKKSG